MLKAAATIEQIGREIVDFLGKHITVDQLILFGSYAHGNPRKDSDFDILVVSQDFENMDIFEKMKLFSEVTLAIDSRIELKGFSKSKFLNPENGSLLEMIKKRGKVIFSKSEC